MEDKLNAMQYEDNTKLEAKLASEYKLYINKYGKDITCPQDYTKNPMLNINQDIESVNKLRNKSRTMKRYRYSYHDSSSYKDVLNNMYKRNMTRLARNRIACNEIYNNQENWIRDMKSHLTKRTYAFPTKL